jgi:heptosyltransferase-2
MSAPRERSNGEHILIVRLVALGDLITASTLVERIRAERPGARVSWLVGKGGAPLVRLFPGVDEVIAVDEERLLRGSNVQRAMAMLALWRRLLRNRYSEVIIAHPDRRYALIALGCIGARVRTLSRQMSGQTNPIPGRFFGDEFARLLGPAENAGPLIDRYEICDLRPQLAPLRSGLVPATDRPLVVLVPGGARNIMRDTPVRRWPVTRYADIARALVERGCDVALIGDRADRWAADACAGIPVLDLLGTLTLEETLGVLARASLVISHDTGPLHLARAVRAPIIALFGPTIPRQVLGATPPNVIIMWGGEQLACRPCYNGRDFALCQNNLCMQDISVAQVIDHAEQFLNVDVLQRQT